MSAVPHGQNTPKAAGRSPFPHSTTLSGATTYEGDHAVTGSHSQIRSPYSQGRHAYAGSHTIDSLPTVSESPDDRRRGCQNVLSSPSTPSHACGPVSSTVPTSSYGGESMTRDVGLQAGSGMFPAPAKTIRSVPFSFSRWGGGFTFTRRNAASKALDADAALMHEYQNPDRLVVGAPTTVHHVRVHHAFNAEDDFADQIGTSNGHFKSAAATARGPAGMTTEGSGSPAPAVAPGAQDGVAGDSEKGHVHAGAVEKSGTGMLFPVRLCSCRGDAPTDRFC